MWLGHRWRCSNAGELFTDHETGEAELEGVKDNKIEVHNSQALFDGNQMHGTMPFEGERYAIILYASGNVTKPVSRI